MTRTEYEILGRVVARKVGQVLAIQAGIVVVIFIFAAFLDTDDRDAAISIPYLLAFVFWLFRRLYRKFREEIWPVIRLEEEDGSTEPAPESGGAGILGSVKAQVASLGAWMAEIFSRERRAVSPNAEAGVASAATLAVIARSVPSTPTSPTPSVSETATTAVAEPPVRPIAVSLFKGFSRIAGCSIDTTFGRAHLKGKHPDARFLSDQQFRLHRDAGGCWQISHMASATNETLLNGHPIGANAPLDSGAIIAVGNSAKGISKFPLLVKIQ
jgi:hypothetical protein